MSYVNNLENKKTNNFPMSPCKLPSLNDHIIYIKNGIGELLLHKSQLNGQNMALTPDIFFNSKKHSSHLHYSVFLNIFFNVYYGKQVLRK